MTASRFSVDGKHFDYGDDITIVIKTTNRKNTKVKVSRSIVSLPIRKTIYII